MEATTNKANIWLIFYVSSWTKMPNFLIPFSVRSSGVKPSEAPRDLSVIPATAKTKKRAVVFNRARAAKNKVRKTAHGCDAGRFALFCIAHTHIHIGGGGVCNAAFCA